MPGGSPHAAVLRRRAVRMVAEAPPGHPTEWATIDVVATGLAIGTAETLRQARVDEGSGRRQGARCSPKRSASALAAFWPTGGSR
ncbi:hypothetical protein HII36_42875 [Nonomuraea sp. NN258]|uniref:hypothetical protein n=1 Tax=Nonomuraea antri TaxID=2730852 RepID=UPI0015694E16|nr:hypothetical protein [Nonomuraea antri]NRQ38523.1 hypothetical protein [Nonomuraea antri]